MSAIYNYFRTPLLEHPDNEKQNKIIFKFNWQIIPNKKFDFFYIDLYRN